MNALKPWHILVLLIVVLLLFGARRLPDLARSTGEALRIFKREVKDLTDDDAPAPAAPGTPPVTGTPAQQYPPQQYPTAPYPSPQSPQSPQYPAAQYPAAPPAGAPDVQQQPPAGGSSTTPRP